MLDIIIGDIAAAKAVVHLVAFVMAGVCAYAVVEFLGRWLFGMLLAPVFYVASLLGHVALLRGRVALTSNPIVEAILASGAAITAVVLVVLAVNLVVRNMGDPKRRSIEIREQVLARSKADQRTRSVLK